MGLEFGPRSGVRYWSEKNIRITRTMLAGNVRLGQANIGPSSARSTFFSARFARCYNISPNEIRCLHIKMYEEKMKIKTWMIRHINS